MVDYLIDTKETNQEDGAKEVSPLSESSSSSNDSLASLQEAVMGAEQKQQDLESLSMILNHLDHDDTETHDEEVKQGMASFLVKVLHNTLRRRSTDNPNDSYFINGIYRDCLRGSRALRVSIICTALEMIFRCSDPTMNAFIDSMPRETIPTLVILVEIISAQSCSRTVRDVILSKVARILKKLCTNGTPIRIVLVEALLSLHVRGETDTRIDAACAIASIATRKHDSLHRCTIPRIEQMAHSLVTTLTIAASSLPEEQVDDVLEALLNLSTSSSLILVNVARRIGTVRVLNLSMKSTKPQIRLHSFMICESLLRNIDGFIELFSVQPLNGEILLKGLAGAVINEEEAELQHFATCILAKTLANINGSLGHVLIITDALSVVAGTAIEDRTAHEAALAICSKAPTLDTPVSLDKICTTVSKLAMSSSDIVRSVAVQALSKLCSRPQARRLLAAQHLFHKAVVANVRDAEKHLASTAMTMIERIICEEENRKFVCSSSILLDLLVETFGNTSPANRNDYLMAVESTLCLIKDPSCITSFLPYTELLPALVTLANSNTSSKKLKKDTVEAIVRLTKTFLED